MAPNPATEPSRNAAKSYESILDKSLSFLGWNDVGGEPFFFDDRYVTRTSIRLYGKSPLISFTIKVDKTTFLMVIPPEIITSNQVVVNIHPEQVPLIRQGSTWCALVLQLKQPIHWIMNAESFIQSTGMGVVETLNESPQICKLASQTNFTMYFPYTIKGKVSRAFSSAPYPQLSDHLIAAPGKKLWGLYAITLSSGRRQFNNTMELLPSYTPPSRSEAIQVGPPQASRKRQRQATDEPDEVVDNDGKHPCRAVPSSDTKIASETEFAGLAQMADAITKRVKDQIAQEVERLADNCLNNAINQKLSQIHQQKTDVQAEVEKVRWLSGRTMDYADKVKEEMECAIYDFRKEMGTMMQGFEEEQRASIDGLEGRLESHQTGKLTEMLGKVLQIALDGDQCSVRLTFPDETSPPTDAAACEGKFRA